MAGGAPTYFEKSCPNCGKPSMQRSRTALNKVGVPKGKHKPQSRKDKCRLCKTLLFEYTN